MLDTLQWASLEERRKQQRLSMLCKIQHGQVALNTSEYLKPAPRISRHSHELAFQVPSTSVDYIKFSFFPCTARDWNLLPSDVIKAPSLTSFRARLQKGLRSRPEIISMTYHCLRTSTSLHCTAFFSPFAFNCFIFP